MSKSTRFPSIVQRNNPLPATDKGKQSVNERGLCISEEKEAKTPPKNKKRIKSIKRIPFNALANRVMTISQEEMPGPLDYYPRLGVYLTLFRSRKISLGDYSVI